MPLIVPPLLIAPEAWQALGVPVPKMTPCPGGALIADSDLSAAQEEAVSFAMEALRIPIGETQVGELRARTYANVDTQHIAPDLFLEALRRVVRMRAAHSAEAISRTPVFPAAASALRARGQDVPSDLRTGPGRDGVDARGMRYPYLDFYAIKELDLRFPKFGGGLSNTVKRSVLLAADAAMVLPYDPVRDRVLLIEQFRAGPYVRGDIRPWSLEPIAGRVDPGETPEEAARREAVEEAGLQIGDLHLIASYYPSPGGSSEYFYSYLGIADLPDGVAGAGGLETEDEDIRGHLLSRDGLMALLGTGEAQIGPLILSALWLQANYQRLQS